MIRLSVVCIVLACLVLASGCNMHTDAQQPGVDLYKRLLGKGTRRYIGYESQAGVARSGVVIRSKDSQNVEITIIHFSDRTIYMGNSAGQLIAYAPTFDSCDSGLPVRRYMLYDNVQGKKATRGTIQSRGCSNLSLKLWTEPVGRNTSNGRKMQAEFDKVVSQYQLVQARPAGESRNTPTKIAGR